MRARLAWRRGLTAVSLYGAAALGFLGTVIAVRSLGAHDFGRLAIVIAGTGFFQLFLDLTTGEALVKFGTRYATRGEYGRLRRLVLVLARIQLAGAALGTLGIVTLAFASDRLFDEADLTVAFLVAAVMPASRVPHQLGQSVMLVRGAYEFHGLAQLALMVLRLAGLGIGVQFGVVEGVIGLVAAQAATSVVVATAAARSFRSFPRARSEALGDDAGPLLRFVGVSTAGSTLDSLLGLFPQLFLGAVSSAVQVGYFAAAKAPQSGFAILNGPVRVILLTEHTHAIERGDVRSVTRGVRGYVIGAALLMAVVIPPLWLLMPWLVELVFGADLAPATDAARVILLAGALEFVFGWAKSFPISIGRPGLRIVALSAYLAALVPALLILAPRWEATGTAGAVLAGVAAYALAWVAIVAHLRRHGLVRVPEPEPAA